jgi:hypothetical protein
VSTIDLNPPPLAEGDTGAAAEELAAACVALTSWWDALRPASLEELDTDRRLHARPEHERARLDEARWGALRSAWSREAPPDVAAEED